MKHTLAILIPSINSRAGFLARLLGNLERQIKEGGYSKEVLLIVNMDNGEKTIGKKRNELVEQAVMKKCEYLAFVDDDDRVADNYVHLLMNAVVSKPDCCSLNGIITFDGKRPQVFRHSIKYKSWYEQNHILYRNPNHLNCVKTTLAAMCPFPEVNHGEDRKYSEMLQGLLKTEVEIKQTLYYYDFITHKPEKRHGNTAKVQRHNG